MKLAVLIMSILLIKVTIFAASITDYIDTSKCHTVIDKQLYKICYSYKYKSA